jgi:hypothetical protein
MVLSNMPCTARPCAARHLGAPSTLPRAPSCAHAPAHALLYAPHPRHTRHPGGQALLLLGACQGCLCAGWLSPVPYPSYPTRGFSRGSVPPGSCKLPGRTSCRASSHSAALSLPTASSCGAPCAGHRGRGLEAVRRAMRSGLGCRSCRCLGQGLARQRMRAACGALPGCRRIVGTGGSGSGFRSTGTARSRANFMTFMPACPLLSCPPRSPVNTVQAPSASRRATPTGTKCTLASPSMQHPLLVQGSWLNVEGFRAAVLGGYGLQEAPVHT